MTRPCDPPDCLLARQGFPSYLDGTASRAAQRDLRAHLAQCAGCRTEFEGSIALASRLSRGVRTARESEGRLRRRKQHRSLALAGAFAGWTGGARGAHLRLLLVPAFAMLLMTRISEGPVAADRMRIEALQGEVLLDGIRLAPDPGGRGMLRGEGCSTGADGTARLWVGEVELKLGERSWLWVEDHAQPRLRLGGGELELEGSLTVTTQRGVLESHAADARIALAPDALEIDVQRGTLSFFDSDGERVLSAGQSLRLSGPR